MTDDTYASATVKLIVCIAGLGWLTATRTVAAQPSCSPNAFGPPTQYVYPLIDWRYVRDGELPQDYGAAFIEDGVEIQVDDGTPFGLASNQMRVTLVTSLQAQKALSIWNTAIGNTSSLVSTPGIFDGAIIPPDGTWRVTMTFTRSSCGSDMLVFFKAKELGNLHAMYHLDPTNFWTLWGGKNITVNWFADNAGDPQYPGTCTEACVPVGTVVPANPSARVVGDFDADGRSDIAIIGGAGSGSIAVAFARSFATFTTTGRAIGDFAGWAATPQARKLVGDFDGDGKTDVALTGVSGWNTLPVAFSNGDGTFRVTNLQIGDFASWAASSGATPLVGDFNHDGRADVALTGVNGWATLPVAFSNGDGSFQVTNGSAPDFADWSAQLHAKHLVGDYNHDGRADIALTGVNGWATLPVAFSNGDGSFQVTNGSAPDFANWSTDPRARKLVGDYDHDGRSDIALVGGTGWASIPIAFSNGNGTFRVTNNSVADFPGWATTLGATPLIGDFNDDGRSDIALTGGDGWGSIPVAFSDGTGGFSVSNAGASNFAGWATTLWATKLVGDFNGDGNADIALTGPQGWNTVPLAIGDGTGALSITNSFVGTFAVLAAR